MKTDSAASSPTTSTGPHSAPVSATVAGPSGSVHQTQEDVSALSEKAPTEPDPAVNAVVAETVSAEPGVMDMPPTPTVTVTPPAESTETLPLPDESKASTIDEAVAEFNVAVGKEPENESTEMSNPETQVDAPSQIIEPVLTPVQEILKEAEEAQESTEPSTPVIDEDTTANNSTADPSREPTPSPAQESTDVTDAPKKKKNKKKSKKGKKVANDAAEAEVEAEGQPDNQGMDEIDLT